MMTWSVRRVASVEERASAMVSEEQTEQVRKAMLETLRQTGVCPDGISILDLAENPRFESIDLSLTKLGAEISRIARTDEAFRYRKDGPERFVCLRRSQADTDESIKAEMQRLLKKGRRVFPKTVPAAKLAREVAKKFPDVDPFSIAFDIFRLAKRQPFKIHLTRDAKTKEEDVVVCLAKRE